MSVVYPFILISSKIITDSRKVLLRISYVYFNNGVQEVDFT